jgi:hypothetical protein
MKKINIVFIQYNNKAEIEDIIEKLPLELVDIYIGINDFNQKPKGNCKAVTFSDNLGYLPAFQSVVKYFNLNGITILSNSDVIFKHNFFNTLKSRLWNSNEEIIAPRITTFFGLEQNPNLEKRNPKSKMLFYFFLYKYHIGNLYIFFSDLKNKYKFLSNYRNSKMYYKQIYSGHGSCLIWKNTYRLNQLEVFGGFLQNEEYFIAENYEGMIFFDPKLHLLHKSHSTLSLYSYNNRRLLMFNSIKYILNKYYNF